MASVDFKVKNGLVTGANNTSLGTAVTVLIGGNVGINDTNPSYRLSVSGTLNSTGAMTQAGKQVLHAANYNSYTPTLTGTGASGTWGISISGTANSVIGNIRGTINGDITWTGGANILIAGESSFDVSGSGAFSIYEGSTASNWLNCVNGGNLNLVQNGKNVIVYGSRLYNDSSQQYVYQNSGNWAINAFNISQYPLNQSVLTTATPTFAGLTVTGNLSVAAGDLYSYRAGGTTGVLFLNSAGNRYLYWDNTTYQMPGAELNVNGQRVLNAGNYNNYAVARVSTARNGVYKLFRNESDDAYNVQTTYGVDRSGYWSLRGYNGDTYHAACYVAYAGFADSATSASSASTATLAAKASTLSQGGGSGAAMTFNWAGQSGQPTWLWGSNNGTDIYVYNPSNFSVNYATYADYSSTRGKTSADTNLATTAFVKSMFYTASTSGVADWNDASNITPGTGQSLLLGNASNGPGPGNYFHPVNFSYSDVGTGGQITQLAVAYASFANELYMRGRYAGSWTSWTRFLNTGNYNSYSPKLDGTGAYGTWTISVTGSAYDLAGNETNWASYRSRAVANMLAWKNYGSGHVIFDASNSTAPNGASVTNTNPATNWSAGYPTLMGWNGSSTYGVRVDSCRRADSAASADGVAWTGVSGRPTNLSSFTNDLGNYGNYVVSGSNASLSSLSVTLGSGFSVGSGSSSTNIYMARSAGSVWRIIRSVGEYIGFMNTAGTGWSAVCNGDDFSVTGNVTAYASDERLKTNFTNITNAVDKVKQLGGYTFDWQIEKCKSVGFTPSNNHEHGLKAQEVQKIVADAVELAPFDIDTENGGVSKSGENYLTVKYEKIIPLLIEAIKELSDKVEKLENK